MNTGSQNVSYQMHTSHLMLVDVVVDRSGKKDIFTYSVLQEFQSRIKLGLVVIVPLKTHKVYGVVWRILVADKYSRVRYRDILKIVHPDLHLLPYQIELAEWMADYFIASLSATAFTMLPILKQPPKVVDTPKPEALSKLSPHELSLEQTAALHIIDHSSKPILIHGVTGSGKTEIYLQAAARVLKSGKQVVMLVPEIALTPQTKKRFEDRFGNTVAVWHSELSTRERRALWWEIRQGHKRLVVGSRSALFLPFEHLGLIVIDEEHEKTYYQESAPRYDARIVAEHLADKLKVKLIIGSATPSLEAVWKASAHQYQIASLTTRVGNVAMPKTTIVDLRQERLLTGSAISGPLLQALQDTVTAGRQAVLLLNRRGHATSALCTTCGLMLVCPNCSIPLTVHGLLRNPTHPTLQCHHCDHQEVAPAICPQCQSPTLNFRGFGTEKVEDELHQLLPDARILRMDSDSTSKRDMVGQMYHDFARGQYDILLGTQMIAKGWDIAAVDLVGVLLAESGLMLPDFHSSANTFNLLVQVAGRSGRSSAPGLTILQTYQPDNPLIRAAALHQFGVFAKSELKFRQQYGYPPFSHIVRFLYQHGSLAKCREACEEVIKEWHDRFGDEGAQILGPAPCFFERLRGKYRYHIVFKITGVSALDHIRQFARELDSPWVIEVDPAQLL